MIYVAITVAIFLALFIPFIHVGGKYYRSILLIYYKDHLDSGGGFISLTPDIPYLRIVRWANPVWFRYIDGEYSKDKSFVYVEGYAIEGLDPKTFRRIASPFSIAKPFSEERYVKYYYADRHTVRNSSCLMMKVSATGRKPENFDVETFHPLGGGFVRDKTGIYYFTTGSREDLREQLRYARYEQLIFLYESVEIVDSATFQITELSSRKCMAKDKNFTYKIKHFTYGGGTNLSSDGILEIVAVGEADGFRDLGSGYYRTDSGLFFSEKRLLKADIESFEVIAVKHNNHDYPYAKDKNAVFYMSRIIEEADPATFQVMATAPDFSFDTVQRYIQGTKIPNTIDPTQDYLSERFNVAYKNWQQIGLVEPVETSSPITRRSKRREI